MSDGRPTGDRAEADERDEPIARPSDPHRRELLLAFLSLAIPVVAALVIVWPAVAGGLPSGDDTPYHAAKNVFAAEEIFGRWHLDGWSPLFNVGSQQYLLSGPGMAIVATLLRGLTLNTVGPATILAIVAALAYVATGPAAWFLARGLGFRLPGATVAGVLALAVSVPTGTGLRGTFDLGLIPHQLAIPLTLVLLGALVRVVDRPSRRWITLAAVGGAAVAVTHLTSAFIAAVAFAVWLTLSLPVRRPDRATWGRLATALGLAVGLSAWWLVPLAATRGPRPPTATWGTPPLLQRYREVIDGFDWAHPLIAGLAAVGAVVVAVWVFERSPRARPLRRWRWSLWLGVPVLLATLQALHHVLPGDIGLLVSPRGFGLSMVLWTLPLAFVSDQVLGSMSAARALSLSALLIVPLLAVESAVPGRDVVGLQEEAAPPLQQVADVLAAHVPGHGRFAWAHQTELDRGFGPVHPELWLAWRTGVNTLNGFGGETVTSIDISVPGRIAEGEPSEIDPLLMQAGVTHLVASPEVARRYLDAGGWIPIDQQEEIVVLERTGGSALATVRDEGLTLTLESWSPEEITWTVNGAGTAVVAIPATDQWDLRVDGAPVGTGDEDGYVTVSIPEGSRVLRAAFRRTTADRVGLVITLLVVAAWAAAPRLRERRRSNRAPAPARS